MYVCMYAFCVDLFNSRNYMTRIWPIQREWICLTKINIRDRQFGRDVRFTVPDLAEREGEGEGEGEWHLEIVTRDLEILI